MTRIEQRYGVAIKRVLTQFRDHDIPVRITVRLQPSPGAWRVSSTSKRTVTFSRKARASGVAETPPSRQGATRQHQIGRIGPCAE